MALQTASQVAPSLELVESPISRPSKTISKIVDAFNKNSVPDIINDLLNITLSNIINEL